MIDKHAAAGSASTQARLVYHFGREKRWPRVAGGQFATFFNPTQELQMHGKRMLTMFFAAVMLSSVAGLAVAAEKEQAKRPAASMQDKDRAATDHGVGGMMGGSGGMEGMMGGGAGMEGMGGMMGMMGMMQECERMMGGAAMGGAMGPQLPPGNEKLQFQMQAEMMQKMGEIAAKYADRIKEAPRGAP